MPGSGSGVVSSFSSAPEHEKTFWFNVNAELIIFGATDPSAQVTIGGRVILLRPDGTFDFRFSFPDGEYHLPAIATAPDGRQSRSAELTFSRSTRYKGEVGQASQNSTLGKPRPENVT